MSSTDKAGYIGQDLALCTSKAPTKIKPISNLFHRLLCFAFILFFGALIAGCNGDDLTIHNPNAKTFFVPDNDEPLSVLVSFPDSWDPGSNIMMVQLLDDDGSVVHRQGYVPASVPPITIEPGSIQGQMRPFDIPEGIATGWHTLRVIGFRMLEDGTNETITGDSERFWVSHIGEDQGNAGLDLMLSDAITPPPFRPGGFIQLVSIELDSIPGFDSFGFDCSGSSSAHHAMLFKGGSHGPSHQHWTLERESGDMYVLPDEVPPGSDYFVWVDKGPLCNGTSDYLEIVAP